MTKAKSFSGSDSQLPTIGYVILSSLAHQSHTGYELTQLMGPPRNYMWEAKHGQVYPTLQLLARHHYVVFKHVPQEGKPDKKIYQITERGVEALKDWARRGPTHVPVRDEFNVKMAALNLLEPVEAIAVLKRQIEMVEADISAINLHLADFVRRFSIPDPVQLKHPQLGLYSAIQLSRDLKIAAVGSYRRLLDDIERGVKSVPTSQEESAQKF